MDVSCRAHGSRNIGTLLCTCQRCTMERILPAKTRGKNGKEKEERSLGNGKLPQHNDVEPLSGDSATKIQKDFEGALRERGMARDSSANFGPRPVQV